MREVRGRWKRNNYRYLETYLPPLAGKRVIDLGAGVAPFRSLFTDGEYTTVDWHEADITANLTTSLPIADETADIVVMTNVLEHLPTPLFALSEAFRIAKRGGVLIGTVPFIRDVHQAPHDFHRYTHYMIERMLTDVGFVVKNVEPLGTPYDAWHAATRMFLKRAKAGKIKVRIARTAAKKIRFLFPSDPDRNFAEGYGFMATKP